MRLSTIPSEAKWLSVSQFAAKYGMTRRAAKECIEGQRKNLYCIQTPAGLRILDPQPTLLAREVAALLGTTKRRVKLLADKGEIPYRVHGNKRFFPLSEVRRLLAARKKLSEFGQE